MLDQSKNKIKVIKVFIQLWVSTPCNNNSNAYKLNNDNKKENKAVKITLRLNENIYDYVYIQRICNFLRFYFNMSIRKFQIFIQKLHLIHKFMIYKGNGGILMNVTYFNKVTPPKYNRLTRTLKTFFFFIERV